MIRSNGEAFNKFAASINDVVSLLDTRGADRAAREVIRSEPLPSLLEQCGEMAVEARNAEPEPIRTIHHFACTGGTLISKCLASMPNTQVLSEVDPLSTQVYASQIKFFPTDFIRLLREGSRAVDDELLVKVFVTALDVAYESARSSGIRMIIRDHAHSHFCTGDAPRERPSLREIIARSFNIRSLVTVRHPLDSYLSLKAQNWINFKPGTLDDYCHRYHRFLDCYTAFIPYHYEDFVSDPSGAMEQICEKLELPFMDSFQDLFSVHELSGDSGRSANVISPRTRRPVPQELQTEIHSSDEYKSLCERLDYDPEGEGYE